MARFFNNTTTTATVSNNQETEQQSNKLGWLKTATLVVGGTAAAIGAAIGARKLYEHFTALDGELDSADYDDADEEEETETSADPEINFMEIDTEPSIFTADIENVPADETPESKVDSEEPVDDTPEVSVTSEKPVNTVPGFPTFGLPMLKAYMRNAYMHYSKLDLGFLKNSDPRYIAKVFYSNMDRMLRSNPGDSELLNSENEILVPFSVVSVELYNGLTVNLEVDLQSDPGNEHIINRIFELQTEAHEFYDDLMTHYGSNESYLETIIANPFNGTEDTVKNILKYLMDEMDARCENLRSEEEQNEDSGEAVASAAENETAATTEAPAGEEEFSGSASAADNTAALEKFRKDMDFLNGLLDAARMSDAQRVFRENLASYITDPNVPEETRNGLGQIQEKITNFLIAEKQAAAIEEANNCSHRSSRKKGGKKNYKKNGRK